MFHAAVTSREGKFWPVPIITLPALRAGPGLTGTVAAIAEVTGTESARSETTATTALRERREVKVMRR
jgi:hypothetical protein